VALVSDGPPLLLEVEGGETYADPQAAITWSSGLRTAIKTDVGFKTLTGRASGETIQMSFSGDGWLLIQPSEGFVEGAQERAGGALGNLLGGG
jgi:uncharacterized protein (AIM24 family)